MLEYKPLDDKLAFWIGTGMAEDSVGIDPQTPNHRLTVPAESPTFLS